MGTARFQGCVNSLLRAGTQGRKGPPHLANRPFWGVWLEGYIKLYALSGEQTYAGVGPFRVVKLYKR